MPLQGAASGYDLFGPRPALATTFFDHDQHWPRTKKGNNTHKRNQKTVKTNSTPPRCVVAGFHGGCWLWVPSNQRTYAENGGQTLRNRSIWSVFPGRDSQPFLIDEFPYPSSLLPANPSPGPLPLRTAQNVALFSPSRSIFALFRSRGRGEG